MEINRDKLEKAAGDIVYFCSEFLVDSDSGHVFKLHKFQADALNKAFARDDKGRLRYWEMYFCWPRKDGKTEPIGTGIAQWYLYTRTNVSIKFWLFMGDFARWSM